MDRPFIVVHGFKTTYEQNTETGKMDRPVDWVEYSPAHAATYSVIKTRVSEVDPDKLKVRSSGNQSDKEAFFRARWSIIGRAYEAWKSGQEIPLEGTPLGVWPGINEAQAAAFRAAGMKTVEQVATMPDSAAARVALPGVRDLQKQAQAFLEAEDRGVAARRLTDQDEKIAALQEQLAAAMALLEERTEPEAKRGPGRPRREVVQEAA